MTIEDYNIVGSYNKQRVHSIDAERSVNLFAYLDPIAKKKKILIPTSGYLDTNAEFNNIIGGFRASFFFKNNTYHVVGNGFFIVSQVGDNLISTLLNPGLPLTTSAGYVGIDANTFQIIIVDNTFGYIYDTLQQTFSKIVDTSFPTNPIDVCYLDGFFVVAHGGTNQFQLSSYEQGMVWGPASNQFTTTIGILPDQLIIGVSNIGGPASTINYPTGVPITVTTNGGTLPTPLTTNTIYYVIQIDATHIKLATTYANAILGTAITLTADAVVIVNVVSEGQLQEAQIQTHPGTIVACRTLHRRLFLFSQFYTEVWENAGIGSNLPFRRNNTALIEYGTPAIGSIAVGFDKMFFISQDRDGLGAVMEVIGTEAIPVSTKALDFQLSTYASDQQIADARSFLMRENGLIFYRMNFTLADHTFVYNVSQSVPQEDVGKMWHEEELIDGTRHPAQTHVYFNGSNYVGNFALPILYEIDTRFFTNDGEAIRRMRIPRPVVPPGYQRIRCDRFQVDLLQGTNNELINENLNLLTENLADILTENKKILITDQQFPINQIINPFVFLSLSKDGGQTYGSLISAPMGKEGERTFRTVWRKLGTTVRGQSFQPKIEFYQDMPFIVLGAAWDYSILPE